jgi:hypothetical protein
MPDPHKIVKVSGIGLVKFPSAMEDKDISSAIKAHKEKNVQASLPPSPSVSLVGHESRDAFLPPEIERIRNAVQAQLVQGKPLPDGGIASVAENEPHRIEINDMEKFKRGSAQTIGHELTHLLFAHLASPVKAAVPPDSKTKPYDISDVDQLRSKGLKLWQLPQEKAASIVQNYIADPAQRSRLGPWIHDLNNAPLSLVQPTGPQDKYINLTPRAPVPPIEAYTSVAYLKKKAESLQDSFKKAGVAR